MSGFNRAIFMGNLVRDIETEDINGTTKIAFTLAQNEKYTKKDGTEVEDTTFLRVEAWGRMAEVIAEYHEKGDALLIEGQIKQNTWVDKEENKREKTYVKATGFAFVKQRREEKSPADGYNPF